MHQPTENNIKFFRLVTGEDIISEAVESVIDDKTTYTLFNPLKIVYVMGKPGFISISLMEWVFSRVVDMQEFELKPESILVTSQPGENLITYYHDCIEHFEERKQVMHDKMKLDAPMEPHDHMNMFNEREVEIEEEKEVPLEELQELIKLQLEGKKRILH